MWAPITLTSILEMMIEILNYAFVGHLNDRYALAAVGLGNMLINITAWAVIYGLNSALETLASQAVGAG